MNTFAASVIIPTLNEENYLPKLLKSLQNIPFPLDVIVVDGMSEDNTIHVVEMFKRHFSGDSSLTLIRSDRRGISHQRNLGAEVAKHDVFIFCDADIVFPSPVVLEDLVGLFMKNQYSIAAPFLRPIEKGFELIFLFRLLNMIQRIILLFGKPYFPGACLLTTRQIFHQAGGFDRAILLAEDVDYSIRAAKLGKSGLINITLPVSARRAIKYGYGWLFPEIPNLFRLLFTGRLKPESIYYPFGEYGGQKAHHVNGYSEKKR